MKAKLKTKYYSKLMIKLLTILCLLAVTATGQVKVPKGNPPSSYNPDIKYPVADSMIEVRKDNLAYMNAKVANSNYQDSVDAYAIPAERQFEVWEILKSKTGHPDTVISKRLITNVVTISRDGQVTKMDTRTDTATLYMSGFSDKVFIATMTWNSNQKYDTTFITKETVDDPSRAPARWTTNNVLLAYPTSKTGCYNDSFTGVSVTSSPSWREFTFTGDIIQFFGERFQGHGNVVIFVDGVQVVTLYQGANPWVTDFVRMQPSWSYTFPKSPNYNSPAGTHKIRFETTAGNQYIIDAMRIVNYTLAPRNRNSESIKEAKSSKR